MSERLRQAYLKKEEKRILEKVRRIPWNRKFHRKMKVAGEAFKQRRKEQIESQ